MSTKNAVMVMADKIARRIVAEQTRARIMLSFDAAIIAAHEVFHMGPGRAGAFANAYNEAMSSWPGSMSTTASSTGTSASSTPRASGTS